MGLIDMTFKLNLLISVSVGMLVGALLYAVIVYWFKLEESELIINMVRKRLPGRA